MVVGYFARETWYDCGTFWGRKTNHQVHEKKTIMKAWGQCVMAERIHH